ncbi:MAG TPA: AI-2E family transporter [Candidatus Cybelea sp.]
MPLTVRAQEELTLPEVRLGSVTRWLRALIVVGVLIGIGVLAWMLGIVASHLHNILTTIIAAVFFAYMIFPPVHLLNRRMPRALAVLVVYVVVLCLIAVAVAYLAPIVARQGLELSRTFPAMLQSLERQAADPTSSSLLKHLPPEIRTFVLANLARAGATIGAFAAGLGLGALSILRGTVTFAVDVLLTLTLTFFFVTDVERIRAGFMRLVPKTARSEVTGFIDEADYVIAGFVRGQVILALIIGIASTLILVVMRVPYALLLGVVAGIASLIPILGEFIGGIPMFVVALVAAGPIRALIVLGLFILVFEAQGRVLAPIIVGKSVGVSALVIFIAIVVGAETLGILGVVLAVPVAGILRIALDRIAVMNEQSPGY